MNISSADVVRSISEILRCSATLDDEESYIFHPNNIALAPLRAEELSSLVDTINNFDERDGGSVATKTSYEVAIQSGRPGPTAALREDINFSDPHSGLSYRIGPPSDAYVVYVCLKLLEAMDPRQRMRLMRSSFILRDRVRASEESIPVIEAIKYSIRVRTLNIVSNNERPKAMWKQYADALFFHVGYNLDIALIPDRNLAELVRPAKISSMRRSTRADLDAPRRLYVSDLVYHYQLGVSAESSMLEYISYYHVAEHWFEDIYQDDLVEQIKLAITSPSFSYKRKKDLQDIIRKVSRAVQLRNEQLIINEQVALRLTLAKYVDIGQLTADLNAFDPTLLRWYSTRIVSFCNGDLIDFNQSDTSKILSSLAGRIYKTRNALVHSKEGSKGKFIPFEDDRHLEPEVPLMRFVAEQIIIATSTIPG